ncbi:MAG: ATP-binding protein [Holophaga sp.]|nr:ATP-binding protein [Holophaga sp.]
MATDPFADPGSRLLLQAVPGCAALVDGGGTVLGVNPAWMKDPGGNPFLEGLGPGSDYLEHCRRLSRAANPDHALVATSIVAALQGRIRAIKLEYPVPGPAGKRWFSMTITGSEASGTVLTHLDVTERMAWETRVRRNEILFKATTENAQDLIAIVAEDGRTVYASPSYGKILGYGAAALAAVKLVDLVCAEDQGRYRENCAIGLSRGISPLFEYGVRHQDGQLRQLEARAVAVDNPGGERDSILLISRDISSKKEAERERARMETRLHHAQKMEAIGQLSAGIAHEINTPCQYLSDNLRFLQEAFGSYLKVIGSLEAVPDTLAQLGAVRQELADQDIAYLSEEVPRALQQSLDGLARISTIVHAMRAFGHPGGEDREAVDLNEVLRNTVVVAQGEWKYVAEVETDLDPRLPPILCSPGEMNQVFLNLIVNAAHAIAEKRAGTPGTKGRITLATRMQETMVEIRVADTGAGIPEEIRDQVFLPFFTTKPVGKGTGQGLSIVHSVIAKAGGSIEFESVAGQGTCFVVRLPFQEPPPS